jgi:hypothetical protein
LAHCLAKIEEVILIDGKGARFGWWGKECPASRVSFYQELLLNIKGQRVVKLLEAATAHISGGGLEATACQDAAIGTKQLHLAMDREASLPYLVNRIVANRAHGFL